MNYGSTSQKNAQSFLFFIELVQFRRSKSSEVRSKCSFCINKVKIKDTCHEKQGFRKEFRNKNYHLRVSGSISKSFLIRKSLKIDAETLENLRRSFIPYFFATPVTFRGTELPLLFIFELIFTNYDTCKQVWVSDLIFRAPLGIYGKSDKAFEFIIYPVVIRSNSPIWLAGCYYSACQKILTFGFLRTFLARTFETDFSHNNSV